MTSTLFCVFLYHERSKSKVLIYRWVLTEGVPAGAIQFKVLSYPTPFSLWYSFLSSNLE